MRTPHELLRALDSHVFLGELAPSLTLGRLGRASRAVPAATVPPAATHLRTYLADEGLAELPAVADAAACEAVAEGISRFVAAGFPAAFVYAFDEAWAVGESVRAAVSGALGTRYVVVADVWAWTIAPGQRGWPAHRGIPWRHLDRARPEFINTWVALRDVPADRACLFFVPLDDDPGYSRDLERTGAPLEVARALPAAAGTAFAWNANVLHWGGPCSRHATGPRVSCSFSLCREDALGDFSTFQPLEHPPLDYAARMDLIAAQILTYGEGQPDVSPEVFAWARTLVTMRGLARKEG